MPRKPKTFKICSFKLLTNIYTHPPTKIWTIDNEVTSGYLSFFLRQKRTTLKGHEDASKKFGRDRELDFKYLYPPPIVDLDKQVSEILPNPPKVIRRRRAMRTRKVSASNKKKEEEIRKAQEKKLMLERHDEARLFI